MWLALILNASAASWPTANPAQFRKSVTCYTFSEFEAAKRRHGRIPSAACAGHVPKAKR